MLFTAFLLQGPNSNLDTSGPMYLGGTDFGSPFRFFTALKNAPLRKGFVGCVRGLRIDDVSIDLQVRINGITVT